MLSILAQVKPGLEPGSFFCPLIAIAIFLKAIQAMQREGHNKCASVALMVAVIPFAVMPLARLFPSDQNSMLIFLVVAACWGISGLLSIVALTQISMRRDLYKYGTGMAIVSMLVVVLGIGVVAAAGWAMSKGRLPVALNPEPIPAAERTFEDLNFRLQQPPEGWAIFDIGQLSSDAQFGLVRRRPEVYYMVVAEKMGIESGLTTEGLVAIVQGNLRTITKPTFTEVRQENVNGIDGLVFSTTAKVNGIPLVYEHWVASHNGYGYQQITWAAERDAGKLAKQSRDLRACFVQIDPHHVHRTNPVDEQDIEAAPFGFNIRVKGSNWGRAKEVEDSLGAPGSRLCSRGLGVFFLVQSLRLGDTQATWDDLDYLFMTPDDPSDPIEWEDKGAIELDGIAGRLFEGAGTSDQASLRYRRRLLLGKHFGYAITAWAVDQPEMVARLDELIERLELLDRPTDLDDLNADERMVQANWLSELNLRARQMQNHRAALRFCEEAFKLEPDNVDAINSLAWAHEDLGAFDKALELLDAQVREFPQDLSLQANRAFQLFRLERGVEGLAVYEHVFAEGFEDEAYLQDYISQLEDRERYDDAIAVIDRELTRQKTRPMQMRRASLLRSASRYDEALSAYDALREPGRQDTNLDFQTLLTHYHAKSYAKCRDICQQLLERGEESGYLHYLVGSCEIYLNRYPEAKAALQAALALEPHDPDTQDLLQYVSGLLGQGDNSMLRDPIEVVPIPARYAETCQQLAAANDGRPLFEAYRVTSWDYQPEEALRRTSHRSIRINDKDELGDWGTLVYSFNPLVERIYVNQLKVYNARNELVAEGDLDRYYAVDEGGEMATHDKSLHLPVPGLEPGGRIDVQVTWETRPAPDRWEYHEKTFYGSRPVDLLGVTVAGDLEHLRVREYGEFETRQTDGWRAWVVRDLDEIKSETLQAGYLDWLPTLVLADTRDSWSELGRDYLGDIADKLTEDEAIQTLARELTRESEDNDDRLAAIYRYVQREIQYQALEFGTRGRIPTKATETLSARYGDCKDHSVLLWQLLRAVDVPAHLALMSTDYFIHPELPSLDQFNHMVVAVELDGELRFVDPTSKVVSARERITSALADEKLLVLDPDNVRIEQTPHLPDGESRIEVARVIRVDLDSGDLLVEDKIRGLGQYQSMFRGLLTGSDTNEQRRVAKAFLARESGLEDVRVTVTAPDDPGEVFAWSVSYRLAGRLHESGGQHVGALPRPWIELYRAPEQEKRVAPLKFSSTVAVDVQLTLELPSGWTLEMSGGEKRAGGEMVEVRTDWQPGSAPVRAEVSLRRKRGMFPPEKYEQYRTELQESHRLVTGPLILKRVGPTP